MLVGGGEYLLNFANTIHPYLKFTLESEDNQGGLSFLDMRVEHVGNKIEASWYTKKRTLVLGQGHFVTSHLGDNMASVTWATKVSTKWVDQIDQLTYI